MSSLAACTLVGRLTRDSELKYTNGGMACAHFSIATDERKKKGDQWVNEPSFWDVTLWGKSAESLNQYLLKGGLVAVYGRMGVDEREQDGQKREKVKITADAVQLLGSKHTDSPAPQREPEKHEPLQGKPIYKKPAPAEQSDFSDDIPF